jgi:hypothetical protein
MSSLGAIAAGKAFVEFLLDDKRFSSGLARAGQKLKKWGSAGAAATAPLVAGFTAATAAFVSMGSELTDMSARTGISAQTLSELKFAAGQTGANLDAVEKSVKRMQAGILDASMGTGELKNSLGVLGLDLEQLKAQSPEEQFLTLTRAIAGVEDPTLRAGLAQRVFGRSGTELLPLMAAGADGLDKLRQEANDLGLTMDGPTAAAAEALGDSFDKVKSQLFAMGVQVGSAIAGPLTEFLEWATTILAKVIAWIQANPTLVKTIAAVTAAIAGVSAAAITFGTILTIITAHPIIAALTVISALLVGIATYFGLASDGADEFSKTLDKLPVPKVGGGTGGFDEEAARAQAQLQAAVAAPVTVPIAREAEQLSSLSMEQLEEIATHTGNASTYLQQILELARAGDGGLIPAF